MAHIVLLGDSIFDNAVYVSGGPDVVRQLRDIVPERWQATLLAVDGAVTSGVAPQLKRMPADATHLVVSVGGNDALGYSYLLGERVRSVGEGVAVLEQAQRRFAAQYREMLDGVLALGVPTAVCTIYDTPPSAANQRIIRAALALFNDQISRTAFSRRLPLIDLRLICNEEGDYANPIEPSVQGGAKMASAILAFARRQAEGRSWVIAAPEPD
ncbi:MAG TPA: SGNH/GDSL hydrolase family protein [Allosphingosinicella sp.]|nr:SGNH/GDSL hydrolase family protein [Allosphingosinicella sp.]